MSAPEIQKQDKIRIGDQESSKIKEELEMGAPAKHGRKGLVMAAAKIAGGLALGGLLLAVTALPTGGGTTDADGPSRPLVTEETVVDRGNGNTPDDAWRFDSPFYDEFRVGSRVEVQDIADDAWRFDSPFYDKFLAGNRVEVQDIADDAWRFDSPFYDEFLADNRVEVQDTADDAWRFDSPFYDEFLVGGNLEAQETPDDAWMFDSPYYEDFRS